MGNHQQLVDQAVGGELPKLAIDFFIVFSRFECALKRSGTYAFSDRGRASADWDRFARDLGDDFLRRVAAQGVAHELINCPPKRQVLLPNGRGLGWLDSVPVTTVVELFLAIRRVRNNLVHGAKYRDGATGLAVQLEGAERDDVLLDQSLTVLGLALEASANVQRYFGRF
ncbi:hypothetical protein [Pseudomonas sp. p21]|uniref:hypothetical protein n=1 Tax=Pseudomonas sp. p21 TaxID=1825979 RepID=UPI0007C7D51F|nr:hypothetical protein [Pseudomonas sp. p21]